MNDYLHYKDRKVSTAAERAKQNQKMKEGLKAEQKELEAERERSRLRAIEYDRWWSEKYAAMNLDDIIEIPCIENGEKVMRRFHERGGRLTPVED